MTAYYHSRYRTLPSFVTSDGVKLAYYVDDFTDPWTTPPTLVMLHPAMGSAKRYYAMVPRLARHYRTVRLDLRGHGASQVPADELPFSLERLARDAVELIDHLKIDKVHVIGSSAGGFITQRIAMNFPQRVHSIVLIASKPGLKRSQASEWLAEVARMGLRPFLKATISLRSMTIWPSVVPTTSCGFSTSVLPVAVRRIDSTRRLRTPPASHAVPLCFNRNFRKSCAQRSGAVSVILCGKPSYTSNSQFLKLCSRSWY